MLNLDARAMREDPDQFRYRPHATGVFAEVHSVAGYIPPYRAKRGPEIGRLRRKAGGKSRPPELRKISLDIFVVFV